MQENTHTSAPAHVQQLNQALAAKNQAPSYPNDELGDKKKVQFKQYENSLIRRKTVEQMTALSRSRIYVLMEKGEFPKPVRLGEMSVAWVLLEVQQWIEKRIAERKIVEV